MRLSEAEFEQLVVNALDSLPEGILKVLDNVDVVIEPWPTDEQLDRANIDGGTLLGLYEGIPLTGRDSGYFLVPPDKITIFQRPIERMCGSRAEIADQVRMTVIHEIAHHFGIDEARLEELGWA